MQEMPKDTASAASHNIMTQKTTKDIEQAHSDTFLPLIEERKRELRIAAIELGRQAKNEQNYVNISNTALIILGAIVATKEIASWVSKIDLPVVHIVYIAIGITIAILAGLKPRLKRVEETVEGLRTLSNECHSTRKEFEIEIARIKVMIDGDRKNAAELELLTHMDEYYRKLKNEASRLKVNVVLTIVPPSSRRY